MNLEKVKYRTLLSFVLDSFLVLCSFFATYYLRKPFDEPPFRVLAPLSEYAWLPVLTLPLWWLILLFSGVYSTSTRNPRELAFLSAKVALSLLLVLSLVLFLFNIADINRSLVVPFVLLSSASFGLWRWMAGRFGKSLRTAKKILVVGEGERLWAVLNLLKTNVQQEYELIGVLTDDDLFKTTDLKVSGRTERLHEILHQEVVDEVIFALTLSGLERKQELLNVCETLGVNVLVMIDEYRTRFPRVDIGMFFGRPFLYLSRTTGNEFGLWAKSILDRTAALLVLVFTFPLMILIALLIKLTSAGPLLFVQERTGLNGRKFRMFKFRTMTMNAPQQKASLTPLNHMSGPVFKLKNDPRVTFVGKFLRKYSLDELPQFLNVLKGDMSMVGPRPLPCEEAAQIEGVQRRRMSVKPGITCIWQISGRNNLTFDEWMNLDLQYVDNWSLGLDVKILLRTPAAIISSKGAF